MQDQQHPQYASAGMKCESCIHFGTLKGRAGVSLGHVCLAPITTEPPPDGVTRAEHPFVYQADVDGTCELWTVNTTHMKLTREEILAKLRTILVEQLGCRETEITESTTFRDLGADSLDDIEIVMAVEEEFAIDISDAEAENIKTVAQAIEHIERELV